MFKFKISSNLFNDLLKRLSLVSSSVDSEASIIFEANGDGDFIDIFYKSKVDKGDVFSYFKEKLECIDVKGSGRCSVVINELKDLRIPSFVNEDRFPYCKEINIICKDKSLEIVYNVVWSEDGSPNSSKLVFPIIETVEEDYNIYSKVIKIQDKCIVIDAQDLVEAVTYCNFFKHDSTSKDNNGCLLVIKGNKFYSIGTDSNVAAKYTGELIENTIGDIKTIISNSVFKLIKVFVSDIAQVKVRIKKASIYIDTGNRQMVVPSIVGRYIIEDPESFFKIEGDKLANIELRPVSTTIATLIKKVRDDYKSVTLKLDSKKGLNLFSGKNISENVPTDVIKEGKIILNGEYFITVSQRLAIISGKAGLFYDKNNRRISLLSDRDKLLFLIQGQREA